MSLTYDEALDYLYGLINYERQRPERYAPEVVSLDRPRALMAGLGNPQERYPILHVTGTKGKGSVSALSARSLEAAGLRVGLYSSPHLQEFRERFRINGEMIEPATVAALVDRIRPVAETIPGLTWFEVITAIGFLYFAEAQVDIAVIEVGLGGRLDSTNIIEKPLTTTITSLSYDHMHLLGNTLGQIAYEKAGIIKPGVPLISAPQAEEARSVIVHTAAERHAPLTEVGWHYRYQSNSADEFGQTFTITSLNGTPYRFWTPLLGSHQVINGAVALATLHAARAAHPLLQKKLTDEAIAAGFRQVNWPGRLEVARRQPWLVLDVAHNAASTEFLVQSLRAEIPYERLVLIFGAFTDKDVKGMFKALLPATSHLIVLQAINPRAFGTDQLVEMAREAGYTGPIDEVPTAEEALAHAEKLIRPNDLIAVTGSFSVVGEMRSVLKLAPTRAAYLDEATVQTLRDVG